MNALMNILDLRGPQGYHLLSTIQQPPEMASKLPLWWSRDPSPNQKKTEKLRLVFLFTTIKGCYPLGMGSWTTRSWCRHHCEYPTPHIYLGGYRRHYSRAGRVTVSDVYYVWSKYSVIWWLSNTFSHCHVAPCQISIDTILMMQTHTLFSVSRCTIKL